MNIAIAGTGYVGLVTGVCLASFGYNVSCVDINPKKVEMLKSGKSPIYENDLEDLMRRHKENISYTTDAEIAYKNADIIFIGVGTPEKEDGSANLSAVFSVADDIVKYALRSPVVVVKSTVPVGTCERVEKYINERIGKSRQVSVASNPEFLAQGTAVNDTLNASRIVIGTENKETEKVLKDLYEPFGVPIVATNRKSSEMIKYASNDFLALKISYINEIANLCERIGADITDVARGMGLDARIGSLFLKAGIGYGGSCFPKDTKALYWLSGLHGAELKTIKAAIDVNEDQRYMLIKKSRKYYESLEGLTVAVLGLTFKPGTDDLREAPSLKNIPLLLDEGARVKAFDPIGIPNFKAIIPEGVQYCDSVEETVKDADLCLILTEWPEIVGFDTSKFSALMRKAIVIDGRNCYNISDIEGKGIIYESIGRRIVFP